MAGFGLSSNHARFEFDSTPIRTKIETQQVKHMIYEFTASRTESNNKSCSNFGSKDQELTLLGQNKNLNFNHQILLAQTMKSSV